MRWAQLPYQRRGSGKFRNEVIAREPRYIAGCTAGIWFHCDRWREHPAINRLEPRHSVVMDGRPCRSRHANPFSRCVRERKSSGCLTLGAESLMWATGIAEMLAITIAIASALEICFHIASSIFLLLRRKAHPDVRRPRGRRRRDTNDPRGNCLARIQMGTSVLAAPQEICWTSMSLACRVSSIAGEKFTFAEGTRAAYRRFLGVAARINRLEVTRAALRGRLDS